MGIVTQLHLYYPPDAYSCRAQHMGRRSDTALPLPRRPLLPAHKWPASVCRQRDGPQRCARTAGTASLVPDNASAAACEGSGPRAPSRCRGVWR